MNEASGSYGVISHGIRLRIRVKRFLRSKCPYITLAGCTGIVGKVSGSDDTDTIAFLATDSAPKLKWWQKIFSDRPRRLWLGTLYLSDKEKGAKQNKWLMEVYGNESLPLLEKISEMLCNEFKVSIHLKLERETSKEENFPGAYSAKN